MWAGYGDEGDICLNDDLEGRTLALFGKFIDKTVTDIEIILDERLNPKSKNYLKTLGNRILQSDPDLYRRLYRAEIQLRIVRLSNDGLPKGNMPFPDFHPDEIKSQEWATSDFKRQLSSRFLFIVFDSMPTNSDDTMPLLRKIGFWSISEADLNRISTIWEDTKSKIVDGRYDFIGKAQSTFAYVKPYDSSITDTSEREGKQTERYSFWLNNTYISEIIRDIPEMTPAVDDDGDMSDISISDGIKSVLSS